MLICRIRYTSSGRRCVSCFTSRSLSNPASKTPAERHEILTLLHKTTSLLPRALPSKEQAVIAPESLDFWKEILTETYNGYVSKKIKPVHIAVYGVDQWSGARELVTALLEEPLTSDQSLNERIRDRWQNHAGQHSLTLSPLPSDDDFRLPLTSAFFQHFPAPVQITELSPSSDDNTSSTVDQKTSEALSKADIAVIACNPITTSIPALLREPLFRNPNTLLIVTSTPSTSIAEDLQTSILNSLPEKVASGNLKILFADPSRAAVANENFKSNFQSSSAIQRYQDNFVGSQVSSVTAALKNIVSPGPDFSESSLRSQTALSHIRAALSTCQAVLHRARNEMEALAVDVCTLKARIEEAKARAHGDVLGPSSSGSEGDAVIDAVNLAAKEVKVVMDRLTWWRMVWRVDEISLLLTQAVFQPGCGTLEQQLILQSGRLSALQEEITKSTFAVLAAHSKPPFNSAILQNSLHQLKASPSFHLTPHTLTHPINTRREQIIKHPTTRLHVAAQRATLGMSGSIAGGAGLSWAGWVGWLAGSGDGLLGAVGLDAGTAMGVGLLTAVAGVRWGVGKWEHAKRRWWEDWERVGNGLGRDLRATLNQTMQDNVLVVAVVGCEKLSELIKQRRSEIEDVEEELDTLTTTLDSLEYPSK
ncbi:hypothetical protein H0H87_003750 [Tephrocybe sp. NHM501043]|nr:hypothetical protein H0H87_003750 [Tephrocybe sp. NHM501043]